MKTIPASVKNFSKKELSCRCCGLFNYKKEFLLKLQEFRDKLGFPLIVTCGCRCKTHNLEVGGEPTSCHEATTKEASAIDVTSQNLQAVFNLAIHTEYFNEVIWYKSKNFIHLGIDYKQKGTYFKIGG